MFHFIFASLINRQSFPSMFAFFGCMPFIFCVCVCVCFGAYFFFVSVKQSESHGGKRTLKCLHLNDANNNVRRAANLRTSLFSTAVFMHTHSRISYNIFIILLQNVRHLGRSGMFTRKRKSKSKER